MSGALYLWLDLLTLAGPLVLSFDKKVAFFQYWKAILYGFLFVGIPFIVWDVLFTKSGIWGFNPDYLVGINIFNLPLEEVLFFLVVPYGCTFIYACIKAYFPKAKLKMFNTIFYICFLCYCIIILVLGWGADYSMTAVAVALLVLPIFYIYRKKLNYLPVSFIIALIPFFIVNGILTGGVTDMPIVWYNDVENSGFRMMTIPIEDVVYGWGLLASNIFVFEYHLNSRSRSFREA